jgi:hypothetical protein
LTKVRKLSDARPRNGAIKSKIFDSRHNLEAKLDVDLLGCCCMRRRSQLFKVAAERKVAQRLVDTSTGVY